MIVASTKMNAQVPQKMSYQAVIRDASNNLLSLNNISMRISILKGVAESSAVYIETQNAKTNINGLVSLQIGAGNFVLGQFSKIDWSNGPYYVFTETDPDGGFDYRITGKSELLSVPFALYALNHSNFDTTSLHTRIVNLQYQAAENKKNIDINLDSINVHGLEIDNNIDTIKFHGLEIDNSINRITTNSVLIQNNLDSINTKISLLDLIAILSNYQRIGKILNAVTIEGNDSSDIRSKGNLRSSNDITLSGNIESLGSNSSIGTIDKPFKDLYVSSHSLYIASDIVGQNIPPTVVSNLNGYLEISTGGFKLMGSDAAFIAPRIISTLTGNASTATKLETPRTINGILFDGSANITIPSGTGTVTTNANLTGVVTSIGNATSIANGMISNSMLANTAVGNLSGINTGDESLASIKSKLGITTLSGSNTGDQILPTLLSLGAVASNLNITGGTRTKITYDAKGLVTAGANATTADIAASSNKNYVTDLQAFVLSNTSGTNTGDQIVPTLESLRRSENRDDPYFDERGILSKLTLSSNTPERQTEEIDLSKTIHKLIGLRNGIYKLNNGFEGQVIYILPFGDDTNLNDINISIESGTIWDPGTELLISKPIVWTPFSNRSLSLTMTMAIFTENRWFITGGTSTQ